MIQHVFEQNIFQEHSIKFSVDNKEEVQRKIDKTLKVSLKEIVARGKELLANKHFALDNPKGS